MLALLKILGPLMGKIAAGPVLDIIDKLVPDADLKTRLKAEIRENLTRRDIALTAARRAVVLSELRSESWMTRSWRPALMFLLMLFLLFFGLILPLMELFAGRAPRRGTAPRPHSRAPMELACAGRRRLCGGPHGGEDCRQLGTADGT